MKKLIIQMFTLACFISVTHAQTVPIADGPFLDSLLVKYPSCFTNTGMGWELDTNCPAIVNEDSLTIIGSSSGVVYDLTPLPYFINLKFLHLEYIDVSWMTLSSTPNSLEKFIYRNISGTRLDTIRLNRSLRYLDASFNPTIGGNAHWPDSLRHLYCQGSELNSLPDLPQFLETLNCSGQRGSAPATNILTALPTLPATLKTLVCSHNALTNIPVLPDGLITLYCTNQEININPQDRALTLASLPDLPASLEVLDASGNKITSLPTLPASLKSLRIEHTRFFEDDLIVGGSSNVIHNGISQLPQLPSGLEILQCGWNNITSLPTLPLSLRDLDVSQNVRVHNQGTPNAGITNIGSPLHDGLQYLNVSYTPMSCLPRIPASMRVIVSTGSAISCLPNSFIYTAVPPLQLCSPINNINQCVTSPVIAGTLYYDHNSNGIRDANENGRANVEVQTASGLSAYSNINGYFEISGDIGSNVITVIAPTPYNSVPSTETYTFSRLDTLVNNAFALQPTISLDSLKLSIVNDLTPRPGFDMAYTVNYENVGTTVLLTNMQINFDAANLNFVNASIPGVTSNGGVLTVPAMNITPGDNGSFSIGFTVSVTAPLGDTILTIVSATVNADVVKDSVHNIIRGSFDPNDKNATPVLTSSQVTAGTYINYLIRFQNTGTDTAFNVIVTDTLDTQLNASSFQMIDASHPARIKRNGNVLTFEFLNILLPDSIVNEPLSHGYIKFRVKPVSTLIDGDVVNNNASIYFDYNAPIITNTITTNILDPVMCFTATITASDPSCIAQDGSITVTVSGGTAPYQYSINGGAMQSASIFQNLTSGTYTLLVQDANMCTYTETVTIQPAPATITPTVTVTASSTSVCVGDDVSFTATATNGGANPMYQWMVNGASAGTNSSTFTTSFSTNADVTVMLTSSDPCALPLSVTGNTVSVVVIPILTPEVTISGSSVVNEGESSLITASVANGGVTVSYQWQDSTSAHSWMDIMGATGSTIDYGPQETNDGLRCIITTTATCVTTPTNTSNAIYFTVVPEVPLVTRLYPNPVRNLLTIESSNPTQWVTAGIFDNNGRRIMSIKNTSMLNVVKVDVSALIPGVYFFHLIDRNGKPEYFKFIKQ